jgi:hypothetical protein
VLVEQGYAVALADFQGLGVKGIHPYTDSRTAGLNMIDAVRAMRHTFPDVSDRWLAMGDSQGAGAAWSANEQAAQYAPELKMIGAVAASPGADLVGLVDKAEQGTLTKEQRGVMQAVIESMARLHPDINRDDFRQGLQYVISVQGYEWGLAVHQVSRSLRLDPNEIKWRSHRGQRPWLAGTVIEHMCALLDVAELAELIASGAVKTMALNKHS